MNSPFLQTLLGQGPLHPIMVGLGLLGLVVAVGIWVMEFSGWTISRRGFVRNGLKWNATTIAIIAVCAALYIAGRPLQVQLIPGIGGLNPTLSIAQSLAVVFGLPGAIGVTFSMPIGDAISGALTLGSVAGFLGHTFITYVPYKLVSGADLRKPMNIFTFYLWAIIVGPVCHAIVVPGWLDFTHVTPPAVAWGGVTLSILTNQALIPAILSPIYLAILYPIAYRRGLYWKQRQIVALDEDDEDDVPASVPVTEPPISQ
jgi:energy-coupling factor transport system substrate-specific component